MKFTKIERYVKNKNKKNPIFEEHYEIDDKKVKKNEYQNIFDAFFKSKESLNSDKKYNIVEIIDFLTHEDNFYATNIKTDLSYKYIKSINDASFPSEGLYQINKDFEAIPYSSVVPINKETLRWQFKISSIKDNWIDCSLQEALHKKEEGISIKSINEKGETILVYDEESFTKPFVKHSVRSLLEDIKKSRKWQYLKK